MTRRNDGLWQQQMTVTENGRKKQKYFYGKTKQEVLRKIAAYQEASENGALFETVADEWWEMHESTLSPTTVASYKRPLQRWILNFCGLYIKNITPPEVERMFRNNIQTYHMAKKTAENHLIVARLIFNFAVRNGYTTYNPAKEISVPKNLKRKKRTVPDSTDIQKIKNSVNCTFGLFYYMALYTGLRKGELLCLKWEDIQDGFIQVNKSWYCINEKPMIKPPKTEAGTRRIPIPEKLEKELNQKTGFIFNIEGKMINETQYRKLLKQYQSESGVSCTAHQLRHAYATMLFENEISVKDAQTILGHAQSSTTQDIYTEIRKTRELEIRNRLKNVDIM